MTNFTDNPEKIGKNSNRRAEIWQMQRIKTHSARNQRRNIRKTRQGTRTHQPPQRCTYLTWTTHHSARH